MSRLSHLPSLSKWKAATPCWLHLAPSIVCEAHGIRPHQYPAVSQNSNCDVFLLSPLVQLKWNDVLGRIITESSNVNCYHQKHVLKWFCNIYSHYCLCSGRREPACRCQKYFCNLLLNNCRNMDVLFRNKRQKCIVCCLPSYSPYSDTFMGIHTALKFGCLVHFDCAAILWWFYTVGICIGCLYIARLSRDVYGDGYCRREAKHQ